MPDSTAKISSAKRSVFDSIVGKIRNWDAPRRKNGGKKSLGWRTIVYDPKWQRWLLIVGTAMVAAFLMAPTSFRIYTLTLGEPAPETIVSPITFKVVDSAATAKNRDEVLKSVRPVYDIDDKAVDDIINRVSKAFNLMRDYFAEEAEFRSREVDVLKEGASQAEKKTVPTKSFRPLDDNTLRTRFETQLSATVYPGGFALLKSQSFSRQVEKDLLSLVVPVMTKGVVASREQTMKEGKLGILLRSKSKDKLEPLKDLTAIYDLKESYSSINLDDRETPLDPAVSRTLRQIAMDLVNINVTYNREKSDALKREAEAQATVMYFQVAKGEPIIKEGEPANEGHLRKLEGLNKANPAYSRYVILLGYTLILILLLRLSFYFSEKHLDRAGHATADLLLFCLILVGAIVLVRFVASLSPLIAPAGSGINPRAILFAAPVATGAMLAALMVDARIAFMFAALIAITTALALEGDVYLFTFYFISGIVGLHGMTRISDRTSILRAGLVVGLVNMAAILAIKMAVGHFTTVQDLYDAGLGFLGGVLCGLFVSGLAPLLEPLGYVTNVKLLEIANLNHALLKEMSLDAPGTYHHSMMVGNLAEAAAELIGANPLLARVGALYHDIGKVGRKTKPTYFIENQGKGVSNPHDRLEPSMSALILVAHVKHGVEKAREYRLGRPIIDIIQQHHGTTLIKFFYNKALERAQRDHHVVSEDKYHYPGPRPQSKEAALVMLADVCEAASRTLTDPTPASIQKRVQSLIISLFTEGQLDQSTLTLKDIHAITKSFTRSLQGILHSRIDYPADPLVQEKINGDTHRQPPDKDRRRPGRIAEENGKNLRRLGL
jgi:cyclic-di-AMP phosphodiesterase PgpH